MNKKAGMSLPVGVPSVFIVFGFATIFLAGAVIYMLLGPSQVLNFVIALFSFFMTIQGTFTLFLMLYAWNDPEKTETYASPKSFEVPHHSFTVIIPARHEEKVIADTLRAVSRITYPKDRKEVLIVIADDDVETRKAAESSAKLYQGLCTIKVLVAEGKKKSKPRSLNVGLASATGDVVGVFDAEDEPHQDIFNVVNTLMTREDVDVVQSGVQLINVNSRWFSIHNVLEYYFWFKSFLQFFAGRGLTPLGGNTVFFKKHWLTSLGGWDETCLTEDADIGIRMSAAGAKMRVVYDEEHATLEETPMTVTAFIKQRTRWNQGFLQIFQKWDWLKLPMSQQLLAVYVLTWPVVQGFLLLYMPFAILFMVSHKVPVVLALFANIPSYLLILQMVTLVVGFYEFSRKFGVPFSVITPFKIVITFLPYQILLGVSAIRAFFRILTSRSSWEKTYHSNIHRTAEKRADRTLLRKALT